MPERDDIAPEEFLASVREHMNVSVGGGGHHPGDAYTPLAFRHYIRERALLARLASLDFATALDVGCAEGWFMRAIRRRFGTDVWGVDISDLAAKAVQDRYGMPAAVADAQRLPFADGSFDLVYSTEVLEHVLDPHTMVAEMRRVARRWVVVTTPVSQRADEHEPDYEQHAEGHVNNFDRRLVREVFGPTAELGSFRCNATLAAIAGVGRYGRPRIRNAFYAADQALAGRLGKPDHRFVPLRNRDWLVVVAGDGSAAGSLEWRCPACRGPLTAAAEGLVCEAEARTFRYMVPGVVGLVVEPATPT